MNGKIMPNKPDHGFRNKSGKSRGRRVFLGLALACLAMATMLFWPLYNNFIKRSRNTASQSLLQQLALAQLAYNLEQQDANRCETPYASDWDSLTEFGFRLNPSVRVKLLVIDLSIYDQTIHGFVANAQHFSDKKVYQYDAVSGGGVKELAGAKALGDEYAVNDEENRLEGPPIILILLRVPLAGRSED